jgi:lipoate-protein ligase A
MAVDEALAESVLAGDVPPTLRFYGWSAPSVTIGAFQRLREAVDLDECARLGVPVVRRPTGGRAVLHHPEELTYSFSSRNTAGTFFSESVLENYKAINSAFHSAFKTLGIDVSISDRRLKRPEIAHVHGGNPLCFASTSYSELSVGGRKIAGSAQRKYKGGFLQQGSIPFLSEDGFMLSKKIFRGGGDEAYSIRQAAPNLRIVELMRAITAAFEERFGVSMTEGGLTERETSKADELVERKYGLDKWNARK